MTARVVLIGTLFGVATGFAPIAPSALRQRGGSLPAHCAPLALCMNAENLAKIVVCTGPTCTRNGGGKKLKKIVDEMAAPFGIEVDSVKCVSDCAECGLGPNIETTEKGAEGPFAGKIFNQVKTAADVARILGVAVPI